MQAAPKYYQSENISATGIVKEKFDQPLNPRQVRSNTDSGWDRFVDYVALIGL